MIDLATRLIVVVGYSVAVWEVYQYRKTAPKFVRPSLNFLCGALAGWILFYVLLLLGWLPTAVAPPLSRALHFPLAAAVAGIVNLRRKAAR